VPAEEELRRVIPVIEGLAGAGVPISIDSRKGEVARRAVRAGATILNDTLGEESEGSLDRIAVEEGTAIVVMHSRGTPETMRSLTSYRDVVADVVAFLARRAARLEEMGVAHDAIVLDPGFGFAKTAQQNIELLRHLDALVETGYPVLVGTSRKSFMGALLGLEVDQRLEATVATMVWAAAQGAHILRVHDVAPTVRAVRMLEEIRGAGGADL
jgi:dihydropteroate synthase